MLHKFFFHIEPLSLSHCIHVLAGLVLRVCLLPKVQIFLLSGGDPEWVTGNDLQKETNKKTSQVEQKFISIFQAISCRSRETKVEQTKLPGNPAISYGSRKQESRHTLQLLPQEAQNNFTNSAAIICTSASKSNFNCPSANRAK